MRGPVHLGEQRLDPFAELGRLGEIFRRGEEAGHQERGLDEVAAVVAAHEGDDAARARR